MTLEPRHYPPEFVTEEDLGVPPWFDSDVCSGGAPDWWFVWGPCRRHDFDYWLGGPRRDEDRKAFRALRRYADREFRRAILHNSQFEHDGSLTGWWTKRKRQVTALVYWLAVRRFGRSSFRERFAGQLDEFGPNLEKIALYENKWRLPGSPIHT